MSFTKLFANKIAFAAKLFCFVVCLLALLGCQKKEVPGHAPDFQLEWVGFSTQEKSGKLYVKRTGTTQENPKLQVRIPRGSTEKKTNRHAIVECENQEIFNKVDPVTDSQMTYNFSKETMPLIKSLPRVSVCNVSLRIFNEEGSSHTENLTVSLIQDSEAPYTIVDETPPLPIVAATKFQLRNLRIKNTSELSEKFFVQNGLHYELKKIFFFDPGPGGALYRYSDEWVSAANYHVWINDIEFSADDQGFYVFELQPQQEVRLILTSSLPGGNCPADTMGGIKILGQLVVGSLPRHYKGALVHQFETALAFGQFETSNSPFSDLITSRKSLLESTNQVGIIGVPISPLSETINPAAYYAGSLSPLYSPSLDDCVGILPDRLR